MRPALPAETRRCVGLLTAIAIGGALAMAPCDARAQARDEADARAGAALRAFWSTLDEAWNGRDAGRFSNLFSADGSFRFVSDGPSLDGRAMIHRFFVERFAQLDADLRHVTTVRDVRAVAPEVGTVDGTVEIVRAGPGGGEGSTVLRAFSTFAVMHRASEGWMIRELRAYRLPDPTAAASPSPAAASRTAPLSTVEFRSYNLRPGAREEFHRLVLEESLPMLERWNIDVVGYGPSAHDESSYILIRAFPSVEERQRSEDAFYGSAEWVEGPREAVLSLIESFTTIVLELDPATVDGLRAALATSQRPPARDNDGG